MYFNLNNTYNLFKRLYTYLLHTHTVNTHDIQNETGVSSRQKFNLTFATNIIGQIKRIFRHFINRGFYKVIHVSLNIFKYMDLMMCGIFRNTIESLFVLYWNGIVAEHTACFTWQNIPYKGSPLSRWVCSELELSMSALCWHWLGLSVSNWPTPGVYTKSNYNVCKVKKTIMLGINVKDTKEDLQTSRLRLYKLYNKFTVKFIKVIVAFYVIQFVFCLCKKPYQMQFWMFYCDFIDHESLKK